MELEITMRNANIPIGGARCERHYLVEAIVQVNYLLISDVAEHQNIFFDISKETKTVLNIKYSQLDQLR